MRLIIDLEKAIKIKFSTIENLIVDELYQSNPKSTKFAFNQPNILELINYTRLDTGIYSKDFKEIDHIIKNYKNGYHLIDSKKLKSGKTPIIRHIGNDPTLKYRWVTPTNCSDIGYLNIDERINMLETNNLSQNSMLLVNRTSRGGKGEYVGIAAYYDISVYGPGQYNQGIYRVFNYSDEELIFKTCFMNTNIMRKYCSYMCVGSKMKEMKANQFLTIPFPNFDENKIDEIRNLYNAPFSYKNPEEALKNSKIYIIQAGLMQLEQTLRDSQQKLNDILSLIIDDLEVDIPLY
jgi:hypothetical protein